MLDFLWLYWENFGQWVPPMLAAAVGTIEIAVLAFAMAIGLGLVFALVALSPFWPVRTGMRIVTELIRGTPPLVILALIYFGLPSLRIDWLVFSSFTAAVLGLGLHGAAFMGEVFRSGIEAVGKGQTEAALSIGMTPAQTMRWVVMPQMFRIVLPPLGNFAVSLLKDTAICSIIAAPELMLRAKDLTSSSFMPMHLYVLAAVIYLAMSYPLAVAVRRLERRLQRGYR